MRAFDKWPYYSNDHIERNACPCQVWLHELGVDIYNPIIMLKHDFVMINSSEESKNIIRQIRKALKEEIEWI